MVRLAQKAFFPGRIPFPLLHIDTTYKFKEMITFRDEFTASIGAKLIAQQPPACLLLDLHNPGLALEELLASLPRPRPLVVAYGSHVDAARLKAARDAGCDLVLPRSKFVEELPAALPRWCGGA